MPCGSSDYTGNSLQWKFPRYAYARRGVLLIYKLNGGIQVMKQDFPVEMVFSGFQGYHRVVLISVFGLGVFFHNANGY